MLLIPIVRTNFNSYHRIGLVRRSNDIQNFYFFTTCLTLTFLINPTFALFDLQWVKFDNLYRRVVHT